jgi:hypothetical protein
VAGAGGSCSGFLNWLVRPSEQGGELLLGPLNIRKLAGLDETDQLFARQKQDILVAGLREFRRTSA